jgi:hypothetical protein
VNLFLHAVVHCSTGRSDCVYSNPRESRNTISVRRNPKTNARWTAEHSDIAAFALMVLIACTHFYVVAEDDAEWDQSVEELPYDIKEFYLSW